MKEAPHFHIPKKSIIRLYFFFVAFPFFHISMFAWKVWEIIQKKENVTLTTNITSHLTATQITMRISKTHPPHPCISSEILSLSFFSCSSIYKLFISNYFLCSSFCSFHSLYNSRKIFTKRASWQRQFICKLKHRN